MKTLQDRHMHWQSIMDRYAASGTSQGKFCEQNQIDLKKFKYYRWQLARISKKIAPSTHCRIKLAAVTLKPATCSNKLYLKHQSGIECNIPSDVSEAQLLKLIQGLLAC